MALPMDHSGIVASTAGAAFALDTAGRILAWNAASEQLLGYPAAKVLGRNCWEVLQGRDSYGNVYCGAHCRLIEMALTRQAIHPCNLIHRDAEGQLIRSGVSSFVVPGHSPSEMAIVHFLNPVPSAPHQEEHHPDSANGDSDRAPLTRREFQVLRLMARGAATREIARELGISTGTVRNHAGRILRKLKAHTRLQAVAAARALHSSL